MFRRYKSGGDEPGTQDEIVLKVDPIVPKSAAPAKAGAKSGKGAATPPAPAETTAPAKSAKSAKSVKSAKPAKSDQPVEPIELIEADEDFEPVKPGKRGLGSRLVGMLARPDPELDYEEDPMLDARDAIKAAKTRAELEAELQREAEEFGLVTTDPVSLYGPNGEEVAALLDSLAEIDDELAEAIVESYDLTPEAERKVAQSVIRRRHRGGKFYLELEAAERAVADWFSALGLVEDEEIDLYTTVADAATDAVDALVLVNELEDEDFNTLYVPWADVMDPEGEEDDEADEDDEDEDEEDDAELATESKKPAGKAGKGKQSEPVAEEEEEAEGDGEFGPNTALVTELLTNLGTLDSEVIVELIEVWREQPKEDLKLAHRSLQELADESGKWREQMRLAQAEVFAWMESAATRFNKIRGDASDWARTREIAGPAVADAVAALVMSDMLDGEDAEVLYDPWYKVVGSPALPVYEDEPDEEDDEEGDEVEDEEEGDEE